MQTIKITLVSVIILNLFAPALTVVASELPQAPQNIEEAKELGENALEVGRKEVPGLMQRIWENEILPVWQKMYNWVKINAWEDWLSPNLKNFWQTVTRVFRGEIEERTPLIKENFETEKEQLKEEAPEVGKSLWEKFKDLIN